MLLQRYSPAQAAAMVGVSASTIRAWCKEFSGYLSDNANPQPGTDRALLPGDVAILQRVKELREGGAGIVDILQALTESPTEALQPYIDSAVTPPPPLPVTPTESPLLRPQKGHNRLSYTPLSYSPLAHYRPVWMPCRPSRIAKPGLRLAG